MTAHQITDGLGAAAIRSDRNTTPVPGSGGAVVVVPNEIAMTCPIAGRDGTYSN
ncbi:hypothetical protein LQK89_17905 (plasmid) [Curtobacterium sp. C1]|uniref:hypothetical protein n=1 Tax=Curtobacterium sp. C1 TaxID=2898151 RepID=UPI001E3EA136|nr:hypothetical protein [Curtobacterium sp. C1]UFU16098.1 hypothetical protein LQK89_17905 [Curtobacterium sp. C1]